MDQITYQRSVIAEEMYESEREKMIHLSQINALRPWKKEKEEKCQDCGECSCAE
jgi:ferredoxin